MQPDRWSELKPLFAELAELPVAERGRRLAAVADPELRAELATLLAAHAADEGILDAPAAVAWDAVLDDAADPVTGQLIGPYRVLGRLGVGGMGVVYRALRADDHFRKEVALKLVRRGMDTESILGRFRAERQILATLDHPNIAQLLDGGATGDGRPYLVMELVDGTPIDRWCADKRLGVRERLVLFRSVCAAVQHAHRHLVVHRDLKPANIYVLADGRVKLLDFGIAKLMEADGDAAATLTQAGQRLLTPGYASPELVRGDPADTGVDVWSLGVLLYELLTGRMPYDVAGRPLEEVMRRLEAETPTRPSLAATAGAGRLRGDLDTIIATAMHRDPHRRYLSVEALDEDLRRHLEGLPIAARPDTLAYRAGKFIRRNRVAVTAACALFAVTFAFAVIMAGQARRVSQEAAVAARERDRAERISGTLLAMFDVSDPYAAETVRGDTLRVRDFLLRHRDRLFVDLESEPADEADVAHLFGRLFGNLGLTDEALAMTEKGLALRRSLPATPRGDIAASLDYLGTLHQQRGEYAQAESLFLDALRLRRVALGEQNLQTAESLNNLAVLYGETGRYDEQMDCGERSLAIRRQSLGPRDPDVAQSLNNLARARLGLGQTAEAEALFRECLAIRQATLRPDHPYLANILNNLAHVLKDEGRLSEADSLFRRAVAIWTDGLGPGHALVGGGCYSLAMLSEERGRLDEAIDYMRRANGIDRATRPAGHPYLGDSSFQLGRLLLARGEREPAVHLLRESLAIRRACDGDTAAVLAELAKAASATDPAEVTR